MNYSRIRRLTVAIRKSYVNTTCPHLTKCWGTLQLTLSWVILVHAHFSVPQVECCRLKFCSYITLEEDKKSRVLFQTEHQKIRVTFEENFSGRSFFVNLYFTDRAWMVMKWRKIKSNLFLRMKKGTEDWNKLNFVLGYSHGASRTVRR